MDAVSTELWQTKTCIVDAVKAWFFELAAGAVADTEDSVIPKSQREATFTIAALHQWEMDANDDRCIDSAEEVCPRGNVLY